MLDGREAFGRPPGHALRRRVGGDEVRMLRLEPLELVEQMVELLVRDLRTAGGPNSTNRTRRIECSDAARARTAPIMIRAHSSSAKPPTPVPNAGNEIDASACCSASASALRVARSMVAAEVTRSCPMTAA